MFVKRWTLNCAILLCSFLILLMHGLFLIFMSWRILFDLAMPGNFLKIFLTLTMYLLSPLLVIISPRKEVIILLDFMEAIVPYSGLLLSALTALLSLILYGRINSSVLKTLKEELNLISARKISDASAEIASVTQSFPETKPSYMLNEQTGELERLPTDDDIQSKIQSYITTALSSVLDKYLPMLNPVVDEDEIADYSSMRTDLSEIGAALDLAEDYRSRFGLSDSLTAQQIFAEVQKRADDLGAKIKEKGVKPDAPKSSSQPQSEQE